MFAELRQMKKRQIVLQLVNLGLVVSSALIIWKTCVLFTNCESPIVVVLSGSMEPGFYRGDLLFLTHDTSKPYEIGDIVVFKIEGKPIPIVHRILQLHNMPDGSVNILTKGDNNDVHDRGLYEGQRWLNSRHIIGRAKGILPYVGMITIIMNDYPSVKHALIVILGFLVFTNDD